MAKPKWATPYRQSQLVRLWQHSGNRCLQGHYTCPIASHYVYRQAKGVVIGVPKRVKCQDVYGNPVLDRDGNQGYLTLYQPKLAATYKTTYQRLYDVESKALIAKWRGEDHALWKAEQKAIHSLGEVGRTRGEFNTVGRDIFFGRQCQWYVEGYGISGLTFRPFAKVRLSSSFVRLHVDIGDTLKTVSKNKRRKAIRYGKPLPKDIDRDIDRAIRHYLR